MTLRVYIANLTAEQAARHFNAQGFAGSVTEHVGFCAPWPIERGVTVTFAGIDEETSKRILADTTRLLRVLGESAAFVEKIEGTAGEILPAAEALSDHLREPWHQPKTGERCSCRRGVQRDNCPACEGTGWRVDFAAIRQRTAICSVLTRDMIDAYVEHADATRGEIWAAESIQHAPHKPEILPPGLYHNTHCALCREPIRDCDACGEFFHESEYNREASTPPCGCDEYDA